MSKQLDVYIEYLRQLNVIAKLDMILINLDGNVLAEFAHYSQHKMIRNRRNSAKKKFIDRMCLQFCGTPEYAGSKVPVAVDGYYFFAVSLAVDGCPLLLCLGPFYIDQFLTDMIEGDLPHYGMNDIPGAVMLFSQVPGVPLSTEGEGNAGGGEEKPFAGVSEGELEEMEMIRLNSPTQIKYNAKIEKAIRTAIRNGDEELMKRLNEEVYFMEAAHYLAEANNLKRMKYTAMIANTLGCRAAEDGGAPSVWVRSICVDFADQIEETDDIFRLNALIKEMSAVYCKRVRDTKMEGYSPHVRQCIRWMHAHIDKDPTLREAAEHNGVSYEYMSRLLNKECGCGFSDLLHRIRCEAAAGYLQCGEGIRETAEKPMQLFDGLISACKRTPDDGESSAGRGGNHFQ